MTKGWLLSPDHERIRGSLIAWSSSLLIIPTHDNCHPFSFYNHRRLVLTYYLAEFSSNLSNCPSVSCYLHSSELEVREVLPQWRLYLYYALIARYTSVFTLRSRVQTKPTDRICPLHTLDPKVQDNLKLIKYTDNRGLVDSTSVSHLGNPGFSSRR
jgi:hypothetical protein